MQRCNWSQVLSFFLFLLWICAYLTGQPLPQPGCLSLLCGGEGLQWDAGLFFQVFFGTLMSCDVWRLQAVKLIASFSIQSFVNHTETSVFKLLWSALRHFLRAQFQQVYEMFPNVSKQFKQHHPWVCLPNNWSVSERHWRKLGNIVNCVPSCFSCNQSCCELDYFHALDE